MAARDGPRAGRLPVRQMDQEWHSLSGAEQVVLAPLREPEQAGQLRRVAQEPVMIAVEHEYRAVEDAALAQRVDEDAEDLVKVAHRLEVVAQERTLQVT